MAPHLQRAARVTRICPRHQKQLGFKTHGGRRPGSGRKRSGPRPNVPHRTRERISGREPLSVTLRAAPDLVSFRLPHVFAAIRECLRKGADRFGLRLIEFSVQSNHLHLVVEAPDWEVLSRSMKGLQVRIARSVNKVMKRRGRVFADRYYARVLETPREVRNALVYTLKNAHKHARQAGKHLPDCWLDPMSSSLTFTGWEDFTPSATSKITLEPRTWLLTVGWKRHGLIRTSELPAAQNASRRKATAQAER